MKLITVSVYIISVHGSSFVGCLTSKQHDSVSQGRICSDNFTCCHTEIEVADQTFYLTQSQCTDTGPTSPSTDPIMPGAWQGSHWSTNFEVTGMTRPGTIPSQAGFEPCPDALTNRPKRRFMGDHISDSVKENWNNTCVLTVFQPVCFQSGVLIAIIRLHSLAIFLWPWPSVTPKNAPERQSFVIVCHVWEMTAKEFCNSVWLRWSLSSCSLFHHQ